VIDNCIYPTPTIAQFISFDKKIKIYDYLQFLELNDEHNNTARKYFTPINVDGEMMYARNKDVKQFKLELWQST